MRSFILFLLGDNNNNYYFLDVGADAITKEAVKYEVSRWRKRDNIQYLLFSPLSIYFVAPLSLDYIFTYIHILCHHVFIYLASAIYMVYHPFLSTSSILVAHCSWRCRCYYTHLLFHKLLNLCCVSLNSDPCLPLPIAAVRLKAASLAGGAKTKREDLAVWSRVSSITFHPYHFSSPYYNSSFVTLRCQLYSSLQRSNARPSHSLVQPQVISEGGLNFFGT